MSEAHRGGARAAAARAPRIGESRRAGRGRIDASQRAAAALTSGERVGSATRPPRTQRKMPMQALCVAGAAEDVSAFGIVSSRCGLHSSNTRITRLTPARHFGHLRLERGVTISAAAHTSHMQRWPHGSTSHMSSAATSSRHTQHSFIGGGGGGGGGSTGAGIIGAAANAAGAASGSCAGGSTLAAPPRRYGGSSE
jgi:hypothetical protein